MQKLPAELISFMLPYFLLTAGWICWCFLHSLLIWPEVSRFLQQWLGKYRFHYRLGYCVFSFITLSPLVVANFYLKGDLVFAWQGRWQLVRFVFLLFALILFRGGAKRYDFESILGFRQIREQVDEILLKSNERNAEKLFPVSGVFACTRHPWYLGGLILLWTLLPEYYISSVLTAVILSFYFIIGSHLEEIKIIKEYGKEYREYQSEVSMLIPIKWLARLFGSVF